MPDSAAAAALQVTNWQRRLHYEYVRDLQFRKYMGKSVNAPFQMITELEKSPGDTIVVPLITRLKGSGVVGDNLLMGNEEELGNHGHSVVVDQIRNAVRRGRMEQKKTFFQLLEAAKPVLKDWAMEKLRDDILAALQSPNVNGSTAYASCTESEKDAWLDANSDRILFGAAKSNLSTSAPAGGATYDHSGSLSAVDSTDDVLTPTIASLAKRMAKTADRHIRPVMVKEQGENFVMLCNSWCFRDLKNNSIMTQANREAMSRGRTNPLFTDGDLYWDGIIFHEVPEIPVISGVGAASIDVAANYLLGAQSIGIATGEKLHTIRHTDDYGNLKGRGVAEIRGVDKLMHDEVQNLVTVYAAAVADT